MSYTALFINGPRYGQGVTINVEDRSQDVLDHINKPYSDHHYEHVVDHDGNNYLVWVETNVETARIECLDFTVHSQSRQFGKSELMNRILVEKKKFEKRIGNIVPFATNHRSHIYDTGSGEEAKVKLWVITRKPLMVPEPENLVSSDILSKTDEKIQQQILELRNAYGVDITQLNALLDTVEAYGFLKGRRYAYETVQKVLDELREEIKNES